MKPSTYILILWLAIGLIVIVVIVVIATRKTTHKSSKKSSLQQGFGFYSDPEFTLCQNSDRGRDCTKPSTQKIIYKCIPHPVTQKGCIDVDGHINYEPKVVSKVCSLPCVESKLTQEEGIQVEYFNNIGVEDNKITNTRVYKTTGSGCNKIVNKKTGIDNTDYFLEKYDSQADGYKLKTCIPSEDFVGYSITSVTCTKNNGIDGSNNCNVSCGGKTTLNYNGIFGSKLSTNVLQYYPTEYDQDGVRRNVCYNLLGTNQVEILNNEKTVPPGFHFPTKCYGIYNTKKDITFDNYYPLGTNNVFDITNYYTEETKYFIINKDNKDIENIVDVENFESIYQNYNNYITVKLGEELSLLGSLTSVFTEMVDVSFEDFSNYFRYAYFYSSPVKDVESFIFGFGGGVFVKFNMSTYTMNGKKFDVIDLLNTTGIFLNNTPSLCNYKIIEGKTYITLKDGTIPDITDIYGIYYLDQDYINQTGRVVPINTSVSTASNVILDLEISTVTGGGFVWVWVAINPISSDPLSYLETKGKMLYNNLYFTGGVNLANRSTDNLTNIIRTSEPILVLNGDPVEEDIPYYYYGTKKGSDSGRGFYYPIYSNNNALENLETISFLSMPTSIFYTPSEEMYSIGPSFSGIKDLNIKSGTVEVVLKYPITMGGNSFFPIGFDIITPGINYKTSNIYYTNYRDYGVNLTSISNNNNYFITLLRNSSPYIPSKLPLNYTSVQEEKIYTYYDLLKNSTLLNNTAVNKVNLTIFPERNYILEADYDVFLSPYKIENGEINRLCYDDNNKPLQRGTIVGINLNDKVYYNKGCDDYNVTPSGGTSCGGWRVDENLKCTQSFKTTNPSFKESCIGISPNRTYFNNTGFLEEGVFENKELICNSGDEKYCFPLKYTQEADTLLGNYELNDEVYVNRQRKEYYVSLENNNNFDPLNPLYWSRIFPYTTGESILEGQKFFIKPSDQDTIYIYECKGEGIAPPNIENLSVYFQYIKKESIYTTFTNSGLSIFAQNYSDGQTLLYDYFASNYKLGSIYEDSFSSYINASEFPYNDHYQTILNNIQDVTYLVYPTANNNLTFDINIPNSGGNTGDTYVPGFGFWTKLITSLANSNLFYVGNTSNTGFGSGIQSIGISSGGKFNNKYNTSSITLKKGDYAVLVPHYLNNKMDNDTVFKSSLFMPPRGINKVTEISNACSSTGCYYDTTSIASKRYLGEFEVINIQEVSGTSYTIKRNVLNVPVENILNANKDILTESYIFYIPEEFINLNYKLTSPDTFSISCNINSTLGISLGTFDNTGEGISLKINSSSFMSYQNYYTSKIIPNTIEYPNITSNNNSFYITNNNYNNQLYSTITEVRQGPSFYYFNEYKETPQDKLAFNVGDVIGIALPDTYQFTVITTNSYIDNKMYSYKCTLSGISSNFNDDFKETYSFYNTDTLETNSYINLFIPSVISDSDLVSNDTYFVYDTGENSNGEKCLKYIDGGETIPGCYPLDSGMSYLGIEPYGFFKKYAALNPDDYKEYKWAVLPDNVGYAETVSQPGLINTTEGNFVPETGSQVSTQVIGVDNFCYYQYKLDEGKLATFFLQETNFVDISGTNIVSIKINTGRGKPSGPSYLKTTPTTNVIDKSGYGNITSFQINNNSVNNNIGSGTYQSKGGFILTSIKEDYANLNVSYSKDHFYKINPYQPAEQYIEGNVIEYTNNNERSYYRNTEGVSQFDIRTWTQIPETLYPENNNVFGISASTIYFPGETISVNNINYKVTSNTAGSDFPSNFSEIRNHGQFTAINNDFYVIKEENTDSIAKFKSTNTNNYPLVLKKDGKKYCASPCSDISVVNYDNNSFVEKIYSGICFDFYNNTYIFSQQGIDTDFWSLSNTPAAVGATNVKFLEQTNDGFNANLYSQYVFDIPTPDSIKNGTVSCSGSCFSNIDNKVYSNSLLFFHVPLSIESQDLIKYDVTVDTCTYITPSIKNISIPSCRSSVSALVYDGVNYTNQTITYNENINYIDTYHDAVSHYHLSFPEKTNTLMLLGELYGDVAVLTVSQSDFDYVPFINIKSAGINYKFGDLWYIKNLDRIISHGYLDPLPGGILHQRSFIYIQKNSEIITSSTGYVLNFVTLDGRGFELLDGLDYSNKYLSNYSLTSSSNSFRTDKYFLVQLGNKTIQSGIVINLVNPENIPKDIYGNQTFAIIDSPTLTESCKIYQKTDKQDYIKARIYAMFGKNFLSSMVYGRDNPVINNSGDNLPGLIFKPLTGNIFGNTEESLNLLAGNKVEEFGSYQDVFLISKNGNRLDIKCNPYVYPLNIRENYSFDINKSFNTSILNEDYIFKEDYSPLNIIETTNPSTLIGISSSGISFVNSGTIEDLISKTIFRESSKPTNEILKFGQLRQNMSGIHYDTSLNCSLFFTEKKSPKDFIISQKIDFIKEGVTFGVSQKGPISQNYNYGLTIDQSDVTNIDYAIKFNSSDGMSINCSGVSPCSIGDNSLYIYYYLGATPVSREMYTTKKFFESPTIGQYKKVTLICQSDLQTDQEEDYITYKYNTSPGTSIIFT